MFTGVFKSFLKDKKEEADFVIITTVPDVALELFGRIDSFTVLSSERNNLCQRKSLAGRWIVATDMISLEDVSWLYDVHVRGRYYSFDYIMKEFAGYYREEIKIDFPIRTPIAIAEWIMGRRGEYEDIAHALIDSTEVSEFIDKSGRYVLASKYRCASSDDVCLLKSMVSDNDFIRFLMAKGNFYVEKLKNFLHKAGIDEEIKNKEKTILEDILHKVLQGVDVHVPTFIFYSHNVLRLLEWLKRVENLPTNCEYVSCGWQWSYLMLLVVSVQRELPQWFVDEIWKRYEAVVDKLPENIRDMNTNNLTNEIVSVLKPGAKRKVFMIDALRWDIAQVFLSSMKDTHEVWVYPCRALLPSITEVGMNGVVAHRAEVVYDSAKKGFIVFDADNHKKISTVLDRKRYLVERHVVSSEDDVSVDRELDELGESEVVRYLMDYPEKLRYMVDEAFREGYSEIIILTDHGFRIVKEPVKVKVPGTAPVDVQRRYAVVKNRDAEHDLFEVVADTNGKEFYVVFPSHINEVFTPQKPYAFVHGGSSVEEIVVPIIVIRKKRVINLSVEVKGRNRLVITVDGLTEDEVYDGVYNLEISASGIDKKELLQVSSEVIKKNISSLLREAKMKGMSGSLTVDVALLNGEGVEVAKKSIVVKLPEI